MLPSRAHAPRTTLAPALTLALLGALLGSSPALAQDTTFHYDLEGKYGWYGAEFDATVTFSKRADGRYDARRTWAYRDEGPAPAQLGLADVRVERRSSGTVVVIRARFEPREGAASALANLGTGGQPADALSGVYRVQGQRITGWVQVMGRDGQIKRVYETGSRTTTPVDYGDYAIDAGAGGGVAGVDSTSTGGSSVAGVDSLSNGGGVADVSSADEPVAGDTLPGTLDPSLRILSPADASVLLAGQQLRLEAAGASPTAIQVVSGPAEIQGRVLTLTGPGEVRLQLKVDDRVSRPVDIEALKAEVVEITILDGLEIPDAPAPHFQRAFAAAEGERTWEPAAILQNSQLHLRVKLQAAKDLTQPAEVRLAGQEAAFEIGEQVVLQSLAQGQEVELFSSAVLSEGVQVNVLDLDWVFGPKGEVKSNTTQLRVYTTYGRPVDNPLPRYGPTQRQGLALNTKLHYELVCEWAQGARFNVGDGADSIGHKVDNAMRHHVHSSEYGDTPPAIPHYPEGTPAPLNYQDIRGWVRDGRRSVSSLYYPPLEPKKDYEQYENYRNNFGWWVLDNPTYAGGRCNQQASLVCDLVGTLGMEAEVYYIERVGRGRLTGRPMRRYFRQAGGSKSWNFHGQAKVKMEDGTYWLYDGSGSSPPRRTNGKLEDLMAVPGPYIQYWEIWQYEDGGGYAPMEDWPSTWRGVTLMAGETDLDPNAADGTYSVYRGRGRMDDTGAEEHRGKVLKFYSVNVGGKFVTKVGEGTADAPDYFYDVHGRIADWLGK